MHACSREAGQGSADSVKSAPVRRQHGMWVRHSLLEVVGVLGPRLLLLQGLLFRGVVLVVRIALDVLDVIFQLPSLLGTCLVRHVPSFQICQLARPGISITLEYRWR